MKLYIYALVGVMVLYSCETKHDHSGHETTGTEDIYYTCSMDPQVIESKPGKCPICKMDLTPVKKSNSKGIKLSSQQEVLANIKTVEINYGYIGSEMFFTGVIKENENNITYVNAKVEGRVDKLYNKSVGDYIRKGDVIYEVYSEMLAATQSDFINTYKKLLKDSNDVLLRSILQSSISKMKLWGLSDKQIEKIKQSDKPIISFPIESSYSGYITKINITEGAIVMEGQSLLELTDYKTLWVEAQYYAKDTRKVNKGDVVEVIVEGIQAESIKGKVVQLLPQVLSNSIINIVRIEIIPTSTNIRPGMQAEIYQHTSSEKSIVIPKNAVLWDSQGASVWIKNKDEEYESKMIHVGEVSGNKVSVLHGLAVGDKLVVSGAYLLQSEYVFRKGNSPMQGHDMSKM